MGNYSLQELGTSTSDYGMWGLANCLRNSMLSATGYVAYARFALAPTGSSWLLDIRIRLYASGICAPDKSLRLYQETAWEACGMSASALMESCLPQVAMMGRSKSGMFPPGNA